VAGDLLDRILGEIRERKQAAQAAYEESQQLQRALAALDAKPTGARQRRSKGSRSQRRDTPRPSADRARRGANREAILAAVGERPGATAREIADLTGIARATVASTLTRLTANGVLERSELPAGGVGFRVTRAAAAD
jgi:DNA-binding transcriptional ArsR family regulator